MIKNVSTYKESKEDKPILSEKQMVNLTAFSLGVRFLKDKNGVLYVAACVFCDNEYEFGGITTQYKIKLINKKGQNQDMTKTYYHNFNHYSHGYKKFLSYQVNFKSIYFYN